MPSLQPHLVAVKCIVQSDTRRYTYELIIRNPSDRGNSVGEADLHLEYVIGGKHITTKVPWRGLKTETIDPRLTVPLHIPANSTAAGTLEISVPTTVTAGRTIDRVELVLHDTFGERYPVSCEIITETLDVGSEDG